MIGIAGSLARDVGVVHQYGIDAVFSVLTTITSTEEAFPRCFGQYLSRFTECCRDFAGRDCDGRMTTDGKTFYTSRRS